MNYERTTSNNGHYRPDDSSAFDWEDSVASSGEREGRYSDDVWETGDDRRQRTGRTGPVSSSDNHSRSRSSSSRRGDPSRTGSHPSTTNPYATRPSARKASRGDTGSHPRRPAAKPRPRAATGDRPRTRRLSRDEVAAVKDDRAYYVSDEPSPYLTPDQAKENIHRTKMRRSTVFTVVIIMVILAIVGGTIGFIYQATRPVVSATQVWQYRTEEIIRGEFLASIETTALVRPVDAENIAPTVSGTVVEIAAVDGANVSAGDILYKLENPTITESFKHAEEAFAEAQAKVNAKTQALEEISATIQALEGASQTDPANRATQAALASSYSKLDPAQIELNSAITSLSTMKETYDRAKTQSESLVITSPIVGTVNQINPAVAVGTAVTSADRLCTISDMSRYCIDVEIPPADFEKISVGQEVRLSFPSIPDLTVTSTVDTIHDEGSIHLARITINEPDPRITVGTAVHAQIIVQAIPDSLIVPLDAITIGDDGFARLNVLLDPSRGIKTEVIVNIIATNGTQAAVSANNIQEGNAVILNSSLAEAEEAQNPTPTETEDKTGEDTSATEGEGAQTEQAPAAEGEGAAVPAEPDLSAEEKQAQADELTKKAEESQAAAQEAADRAAQLLGEDPVTFDADITATSTDTDTETTTSDAPSTYEEDSESEDESSDEDQLPSNL